MADNRIDAENANELVRSSAFMWYLDTALLPDVRKWRQELIENLALDEATRRGYQYAFLAVREGVIRAFEAAGVQMAPWLKKEFALNEHDD